MKTLLHTILLLAIWCSAVQAQTPATSPHQPKNTNLTSIAALTTTAYGRSVLEAADADALQTLAGLAAVENTALSTWAGTTNVTTLGTVVVGTWNGTDLALAYLAQGSASDGQYLRWNNTAGTWEPGTITTGLTINTTTVSGASSGDILVSDGLNLQKLTPGAGVSTALTVAVGSAGSPVVNGGALGTPASGTGTNITNIPPANVTGTAATLSGANVFTSTSGVTINDGTNSGAYKITGTDRSATMTLSSFGNGLQIAGNGDLVMAGGRIRLTDASIATRYGYLFGVGADHIGLTGNGGAEKFSVYGTTDETNYERFTISTATGASYTVGAQAGGTGTLRGVNAVGAWTFTTNSAASTPPLALTGTIYTGGTTTTTKPSLLIEPAGTTSTGWLAVGSALGVNLPSGSSSYYALFASNGVIKASVAVNGVFGGGAGDHGLRVDSAGDAYLGSNHTPNTGPYLVVGYSRSPLGPVTQTAYGQASYGYTGSSAPDLWTSRRGAAHMGMGVPSATPITQTFGGAEASGTNITGGTLNIGTRGTGTGTGGVVNLQSHAAGASSATLGTLVTVASAGPSGFTIGASGTAIATVISAVATKDFNLTSVIVEDLTMTVTGAAVGDPVVLGEPDGVQTATSQFTARVSAVNTVTIRCRTAIAGENPASGSFRVTIIKH